MEQHWRWATRVLVAMLVALGLFTAAGEVQAEVQHRSPYSYGQTFGSALRLIRVDLGFPITESNPEWGYLMFDYESVESGKRKTRGSFQFIKMEQGVKVTLQLPAMPTYHERMLVEKLVRKLRSEHGQPPKAPPKKKPPKKDEDKPDQDGSKDPDQGKRGDGSGSSK